MTEFQPTMPDKWCGKTFCPLGGELCANKILSRIYRNLPKGYLPKIQEKVEEREADCKLSQKPPSPEPIPKLESELVLQEL